MDALAGDLLDEVVIDVSQVQGPDPAPEGCPTSP
jgi:hypothetical protein